MPKINKSVEIKNLDEVKIILDKLSKDTKIENIHFSGNINKVNAVFSCCISWSEEEEI